MEILSLPETVEVLLEVWDEHSCHLVAEEREAYRLKLLAQTGCAVKQHLARG